MEIKNTLGIDPEKLFIVDLSWCLYRGWYAFQHLCVPDKDCPDGIRKTGHYYFIVKLLAMIMQNYPSYATILCIDSFPEDKHAALPDYKSDRISVMDVEVEGKIICDIVTGLPGIYSCYVKGHEADGLMYSVAHDSKVPCIIYSGDDDLLQAITTNIVVARKFINNQLEILGAGHCKMKYGLEPSKLTMYKSIRGCPSDKIPAIYPRFPTRVAIHIANTFPNPWVFMKTPQPLTNDKTLDKYWKIARSKIHEFIRNYNLIRLAYIDWVVEKQEDEDFIRDEIDRLDLKFLKGLYGRYCGLFKDNNKVGIKEVSERGGELVNK